MQSENRVIEALLNDGWALLFQRGRTKFGEIDLIFENQDEIRLIEVKTLDEAWRSFERINQKQVTKLLQNQFYLSQKFKSKNFYPQICWVLKNEIHFVEVNQL